MSAAPDSNALTSTESPFRLGLRPVTKKRHFVIMWWLTLIVTGTTCRAQVETPQWAAETTPSRVNSLMIFGGRLSATDFASTLLFNLNYTPKDGHGKQGFDNYVAGAEYERDLLELARDLRLRAEVGVDDRFGHYVVCCLILKRHDPRFSDQTVWSSSLIHSAEVWIGGKVRWENFRLWRARFEIAGTVGLSGVTRPLGRERQREIEYRANAHLLGFVAPEIGVSLDQVPQFELVLRVLHRSGAGGTFGGMKEGYNADIVGLRYAF